MKRWMLLGMLLVVPVAGGAVWLSLGGDAEDPQPQLPGEATAAASESARSESFPQGPRVVCPEVEFNFGTMDALHSGSHTFAIRNEGNEPLRLNVTGTTCKCTVGDVPTDTIPPGQAGQIEVRWNTGAAQKHYAQTVAVKTNDPDRENLMLRVFGSIRNQVLVEPGEFVFSRVEPDKSVEQGVLIYSQVWPKFELRDLSCSLPGFAWDVEHVELPAGDDLARGDCYRVRLRTPADLPTGHFTGTLRFQLVPAGEDAQPQDCELLVSGKVLRRLSVYGPQIDSEGVIDLGLLTPGLSHRVNLLVKIRDVEPDVEFQPLEATPSFVRASVAAESEEARAKGLYRLQVEIPADAPSCDYTESPGTLRIPTSHPRIGTVDLSLRFSVLGRTAK
ncbi:MAG: DUF1573 domain-containing protein [Pirellulaceae bacterium]|nr:DUF1573 domain-containing protein [Pirellulaceae bacterium]